MLFGLLFEIFRLRSAIASQSAPFEEDEVEQLDTTLIESVIAMVLKLNDATFRPFFAQLVDQQAPIGNNPQCAITFYTFLAAFFDKFKVCLMFPSCHLC